MPPVFSQFCAQTLYSVQLNLNCYKCTNVLSRPLFSNPDMDSPSYRIDIASKYYADSDSY